MCRVEHTKKSHGESEYHIILTDDEMREFWSAFDDIPHRYQDSYAIIWPQIANAMNILDPTAFPTPF